MYIVHTHPTRTVELGIGHGTCCTAKCIGISESSHGTSNGRSYILNIICSNMFDSETWHYVLSPIPHFWLGILYLYTSITYMNILDTFIQLYMIIFILIHLTTQNWFSPSFIYLRIKLCIRLWCDAIHLLANEASNETHKVFLYSPLFFL